MKDYFEYQGEEAIRGSRDAIRLSYNRGLITEGKKWMDMIESRIKSRHTYNEAIAEEVVSKIVKTYFDCFVDFRSTMQKEL
jgi:nucleotidyltransferase substrate binding protein (TIGR01987 family)